MRAFILFLWQIFHMAYSGSFQTELTDGYKETCHSFVEGIKECYPALLQKLKVHLLLHLVDCMVQYGPAVCFNTERYGICVSC